MIPATDGPAEGPSAFVDVRAETIFTLLRLPEARRPAPFWWTLAGLVVIGWLGAAAYIGPYRPNQVTRLLATVAPREVIFYGALAAAVAMAAGLAAMRRRDLAGSALMIAAFLAGHQLYSWIYGLIRPWFPIGFKVPFGTNTDAIGFLVARLTYAVALAAPMLLAWWIVYGRRGPRDSHDGWPGLNFGIGNFRVAVRDVSAKAKPVSAGRMLVTDCVVVCLILLVIMQLNVGFVPILRGTLWPLLPAVLLAAVANALAEEVIFRGFVQPAFIRGGGVAAGLWMQGLLFGLMHWGVSVGVLAALPVSLLIGLGSVIWGKIALDTRGLGWVVIAHAMVDVSVMSAYFVPRT